MTIDSSLRPAELRVLYATVAYVVAFTVWYGVSGNLEFLVYVAQMVAVIAAFVVTARSADYPIAMLWAMSAWGLAHMAGGGLTVGGRELYAFVVAPLVGVGDTVILKYDQVVHAFGFGVSSWVLWHLLAHRHPSLRGRREIYFLALLAACGLGALTEVGELMAKLLVPETNVGGYYNNALDLVFNATGATIAMGLVSWRERRKGWHRKARFAETDRRAPQGPPAGVRNHS